ncbi:MAG: metallophosphoesterase family protein [Gaiellales bacterium]
MRGNGEREVAELGARARLGRVQVIVRHGPRVDELLTRLSTAERFADALAGVTATLVVAGHTHQQDDRMVGDARFVNADSVGLPDEGDGAARWLWVENGVPKLRRTAYDAVGAGRRMLAARWPDEHSVGAALIDPLEPIVVTRIFEERATAG